MRQIKTRVTLAIAALDPNPERVEFDTEEEALGFVSEEIERRVQFRVDHSTHGVTEKEREDWTQEESALVIIEQD